MELKESDIKQFKKDVYKYYKKLFPALERKSYRILKKSYSKGTTSILGISVVILERMMTRLLKTYLKYIMKY